MRPDFLKRNNLLITNPKVAREWHPKLNKFGPESVLKHSGLKVWWICTKGHEWQSKVVNRVKWHARCPYCSGHKVNEENSLNSIRPDIAKEWHPSKNGLLTPKNVMPCSSYKAWWLCKNGHEWKINVGARVNGSGCPYCSNNKVSVENSLYTLSPDLVKEWHPTRNLPLTPQDVTPGSGKKVWWRCEAGHQWKALIYLRKKRGCKKCHVRRKHAGESIVDLSPELAKEWDVDKNKGWIIKNSKEKVWWKCKKGHEWQTMVRTRLVDHAGCPYCKNRRACKDNSLAAVSPFLAQEWHPTKNLSLAAKDVLPHSGKRVWWKCDKGHEWEDTVHSRSDGTGCPMCSNRMVSVENNLQVKYPDIAKEWHPIRNYPLMPRNIVSGSSRKVWWKCKHGHEWQAQIIQRTLSGNGCRKCSVHYVSKEDSLEAMYPDIMKEWNYEKNTMIPPPSCLRPFSAKKVWWKCDKGHEWEYPINLRTYFGYGCPYCSGERVCEDTCLATVRPDLAKEWNYNKNNGLTPKDVSRGSTKRIWWICRNKHEWEASVNERNRGNRCQVCRKNKRIKRLEKLAVKRKK